MNTLFVTAAALAFGVGLIHSVLGEVLIFRRLRADEHAHAPGKPLLPKRNVRILWASWHAVTALGWGQAAVLVWLAQQPTPLGSLAFIAHAIAASMLAGALLVCIGTRARHPGWIGLMVVAALVWAGLGN